ncbi:hypothetical protein M427DRAFT_115056 [Gonapodya prolifera JEL478]|uniref:CUE domain-containing protein n=1 Tax=Gonapodya prolifera (strain JEL478) TaxID=1344416 RepID=A0A139A354_GONPJ|nr:hypothetical protein M427DRAFT_115056 [Gonapodya prolifera JEL478]|eukprot:KXS11237.1 hypothetical protein M427DRAFT_115056 [Gonapodya prolifera JEL478]
MSTSSASDAAASLTALQTQLLREDGVEEKVEVNQRALVDKILARYSGEYTVFRELLQNSNDANATEVEIDFVSTPDSKRRISDYRLRQAASQVTPIVPPKPSPGPFRRSGPLSSRTGFSFASWLLGDRPEMGSSSTKVVSTTPAPPVPMSGTVVYRNNGKPFSGQDWGRLRKIAEGNPDEQKIGFFGVGFYSLFSMCEEPFITSGREFMGFFWRGDQLFTKKGEKQEEERMTTFLLNFRDPAPFPTLSSFGRFLATSLGFTSHLRQIIVRFDETIVLRLEKAVSPPKPLDIYNLGHYAQGGFVKETAEGLFRMTGVTIRTVQLTVEVTDQDATAESAHVSDGKANEGGLATPMTSKPSADQNPKPATHNIFFRLATAGFQSLLPPKMVSEMERTTKKKPPSTTEVSVLYCNGDEFEAGRGTGADYPVEGSTLVKGSEIFRDLVSFPEQGRVVIGFATHQTTGCSMLLSGQFIPTVERESIDFVDRVLANYNNELLSACGVLARICHDDDLAQVDRLYRSMQHLSPSLTAPLPLESSNDEMWKYIVKRATHALRAFAFLHPSTPHAQVGRAVARSFYAATPGVAFPMLSTQGVQPLTAIRFPDPAMKGFARLTPLIPEAMMSAAKDVVDEIVNAGIVRQMDITDIPAEIQDRLLSTEECTSLLRWLCTFLNRGGEKSWKRQILGAVTAQVEMGSKKETKEVQQESHPTTGKVITVKLNEFRYHLNPRVIPPDVPVPPNVVPFALTHQFSVVELQELLGWPELPLTEWVNFVVNSVPELELNPHFAEKVLGIVGRAFASGNMRNDSKAIIISALEQKKVIPTRKGMRYPRESYFKNVTLFEDLPAVHLSNPKVVTETFLKELGVREHVDLQIVLDRLADLKWDHTELVKYLASVQSKLNEEELRKLRTTSMFPKEGTPSDSTTRYRADQLYFPEDALRSIDMPLLAWNKGRLRQNSEEGKLLSLFGLNKTVPLDKLLSDAAATKNSALRVRLLNYFLENHRAVYSNVYQPANISHKFLPIQGSDLLASPYEVFADPQSAVMGFSVLAEDLRPASDKFGVRLRPPVTECVRRLRTNPPRDTTEAENIFSWLSNRIGEFSATDWATLERTPLVPMIRKNDKNQDYCELLEPGKVFFAGGGDPSLLEDVSIVDFGPAANVFLRACGVRDEPSPVDVLRKVLQDPPGYLKRIGVEKYLNLIRTIATMPPKSTGLESEMSRIPWLICLVNEGEGEQEKTTYKLGNAGDIFLVDDSVTKQLFNPLTCPMENVVEEFYERLGSKWLTRNVSEQFVPIGNLAKTTRTKELQDLIHNRAPLLMYDASGRHQARDVLPDAQKTLEKLIVSEVRDIEIRRTFKGIVKTESTTACLGKDKSQTQWHLLISSKQADVDFFDVAQALGRVLFKRPRLNDSLLLSTLLSTSIINLRRKGFPVDRILNKDKARLQNATLALNPPTTPPPPAAPPVGGKLLPPVPDDGLLPQRDSIDPKTESQLAQVMSLFPDAAADEVRRLLASTDAQTLINRFLDQGYPTSPKHEAPEDRSNSTLPASKGTSSSNASRGSQEEADVSLNNLFSSVKSWLGIDAQGSGRSESTLQQPPPNAPGAWSSTPPNGEQRLPTTQPNRNPVSLDPGFSAHLRSNLERSIQTLRSSQEGDFEAVIPPEAPADVVAPARGDYCSPLLSSDLTLLGDTAGFQIFYEKASGLQGKRTVEQLLGDGTVARFVGLLEKLAHEVFGMKGNGAMKIWWDSNGAAVAFNRNRSLYFNIRYFRAWHDWSGENQPREKWREAMIYWFMVFCHEMAHNFVGPHNSEHEFYLSSFAEQYMVKLHDIIGK